ncbi:MAG TPA: hypothetical protein VGB07_17540 [Blastocatellia bacterium]|jgi:hypothetical protein
MRDYVYPSVYFAYFYFFLLLVGAIYFFIRSARQGYWNERSEDAKYRMLEDDETVEQASICSESGEAEACPTLPRS